MVRVTATTRLARLTGDDAPESTASAFAVHATDLGILWDDGSGGVLAAFGDTYGRGWGGHGAGPAHADWRFNVLARTTTRELDGGLRFDWFAPREDGTAGQVVPASSGSFREHTVIPTSGIAIGGRNYLHYMSIHRWGAPGGWATNHGGLAHSDDGGRTWTTSSTAVWPNGRTGKFARLLRRDPGGHPFQMFAFAGIVDGRVYLLGTPNGRFGAGHLARVRFDDLLDPRAYEYWTGERWGSDPYAADPVLAAPVAELSVQYNTHFGLWFATHLDERRAEIVLRTAPELTGPWTTGEALAAGSRYPALYGGFQHPWAAHLPAVYFTMTRWGPYNVDFFRADLQ